MDNFDMDDLYEFMMNKMPVMLFTINKDICVDSCNKFFEQHTGYTLAEAREKGAYFFDEIMPESSFLRLLEVLEDIVYERKSSFSGFLQLRSRGQSDFHWIIAGIGPHYQADSDHVGGFICNWMKFPLQTSLTLDALASASWYS